MNIRKHIVYQNKNKQLEKMDRESPATTISSQMLQGLTFGRFEYGECWDDLRFAATAINPPGTVSDPDFDVSFPGWLFDAGGTEALFLIAQMPHAWKEGSTLKPHIHWQKTSSAGGNVLWRMEYKWVPIGQVADTSYTVLNSDTPVVSDADTENVHAITALGDIDATGKTLSNILVIRIGRIGGDALDTYGADARLLEFDIHYQIDAVGSDEEYSKTKVIT